MTPAETKQTLDRLTGLHWTCGPTTFSATSANGVTVYKIFDETAGWSAWSQRSGGPLTHMNVVGDLEAVAAAVARAEGGRSA